MESRGSARAPSGGAAPPAGAGGAEAPSIASGGRPLSAAVVSGGRGGPYRMYEALVVTGEGATLRGGLLLEVSEEVTLELGVPGRSPLRARARVVEIVYGSPPAMKVVWTDLPDADRARLRG